MLYLMYCGYCDTLVQLNKTTISTCNCNLIRGIYKQNIPCYALDGLPLGSVLCNLKIIFPNSKDYSNFTPDIIGYLDCKSKKEFLSEYSSNEKAYYNDLENMFRNVEENIYFLTLPKEPFKEFNNNLSQICGIFQNVSNIFKRVSSRTLDMLEQDIHNKMDI